MSRKITDIILNQEQILGGDRAILTRISEGKKFVNGHYTDEIDCYKLEVVCVADKSFDKVIVKLPSDKTPGITQEQIEASTSPVYVKFEGLTGKFYMSNITNRYELSCKATAVHIANVKV